MSKALHHSRRLCPKCKEELKQHKSKQCVFCRFPTKEKPHFFVEDDIIAENDVRKFKSWEDENDLKNNTKAPVA